MAALTYFHLVWDDVTTFDDLPISGRVTITPYLNDVVVAGDDDHTTLSPRAIRAVLADGVLKDEDGNAFVNLVCDQALLGLTTPLQYRMGFTQMKDSSGKHAPGFSKFNFNAPTSTADFSLDDAIPVPGQIGTGPAGSVDWDLITDKPAFIGAGATAAAARAAIGAGTGGGSAVTSVATRTGDVVLTKSD